MCENKNSNKIKIFAFILVFLGLIIIILFFSITPFNDWSGERNATLFGLYGDFIGGFVGSLFSVASFILLYFTLDAQQKTLQKQEEEIKAQKRISEFQSFETTFFNLINVHHTITNNIKATFRMFNINNLVQEELSVNGNDFFYTAIKIRDIINDSLSQSNYHGMFDSEEAGERIISIREQYGNQVENYGEEITKLIIISNIQIVNSFFDISEEKWYKGHKTEGSERVKFVYNLFFSKYHYAIGHYFRNMYHILKFVSHFEDYQMKYQKTQDDIEDLKNKCNQYAQFIQAQLSAYELAILHDNAICFINMSNYIVKYNLLENVSPDYLINHTKYL